MYQFHGARMTFFEINACDTTIIYLTEELAEIRATLVPYPSLWEKTWLVTCLHDAVREVDILAKAHLGKSA